MKAITLALACVMVGCLKPIPPAPEVPRVVVVDDVGEAPPLVIVEEPKPEPLIKTWLVGDDLRLFLEEREKQENRCYCPEDDENCNCPEEEHAESRRSQTRDSQASWSYPSHTHCQLYNW